MTDPSPETTPAPFPAPPPYLPPSFGGVPVLPPAADPPPPVPDLPSAHITAAGASSPYPLFYDSCAKIYPEDAKRILVYRDIGGGPAECIGYPPDRSKYQTRSITREGGADAASWALILDYEWLLNAYEVQGQAREWAQTRAAHGHRFISYVPRALLSRYMTEIGPILWNHNGHRFFIPTLDDKQWTPAELAADIRANWGVIVDESRLWGNQFASGGPRGSGQVEWDESSLYPGHYF